MGASCAPDDWPAEGAPAGEVAPSGRLETLRPAAEWPLAGGLDTVGLAGTAGAWLTGPGSAAGPVPRGAASGVGPAATHPTRTTRASHFAPIPSLLPPLRTRLVKTVPRPLAPRQSTLVPA